MLVYRLILLVAVFGATFFLLQAIHGMLIRRAATRIELRRALLEEEDRRRNRQTPLGKLSRRLEEMGYKGSLPPAALMSASAWAMASMGLRIAGFDAPMAFFAGVPVTAVVAWVVLSKQVSKRDEQFRRQLIGLFDLMAGRLESGSGARRAIEDSAGSVQEPLKSELLWVSEQVSASKNLVEAIREMAERYPSQGTRALVAALEMDQAAGGVDIGPALKQAGEALQSDIELEQEAAADLQEARMSFQVSTTVILGIAAMMFVMGGDMAQEALFSTMGLIVLAITGLNFLWGVLRGMKLVNNAGKGS